MNKNTNHSRGNNPFVILLCSLTGHDKSLCQRECFLGPDAPLSTCCPRQCPQWTFSRQCPGSSILKLSLHKPKFSARKKKDTWNCGFLHPVCLLLIYFARQKNKGSLSWCCCQTPLHVLLLDWKKKRDGKVKGYAFPTTLSNVRD